jgi:hypothetical protein
MAFTNAIDQAILDHLFGLASWTAPTEWWVGYSTANPGKDGTGLAEPSGTTGYARVEVTDWARVSSEVDNDSVITFPEASSSQGTATHACLFDGETGDLVWSAALTTPKLIDSGDTPTIPAGDFNITAA